MHFQLEREIIGGIVFDFGVNNEYIYNLMHQVMR